MLPTIIENENLNSARDNNSPNPKSPKKSNSSTHNGTTAHSKHAQNRPEISTETSKPTQAHKRGPSSNANPHFYANIRHAMQPEIKPTRTQRQSEVLKDSSLLVEKKGIEEEASKPVKPTKPQPPTLGCLIPEEIAEPITKSHGDVKQGAIQNPRSARDALKAKFKDREYQSGSCSPLAANNYKGSCNLAVKPQSSNPAEATLNRLAAKYLNSSKSPNNFQQSQKPKPSSDAKSSKKPVTGEKNLLHSSSKQSQKDLSLNLVSSNENRVKELALHDEGLLLGVLKRSSNLTPLSKEQGVLQSSAVKLSMHKSEVLGSGKGERKEKSPGPQAKKNQRDMVSISPTKNKGNSVSKDKNVKEMKVEASATEVRKNTPVQVFLSEEEKAQYGNRTLPDYDKLDLLGKGGFALVWLGTSKSTGRKVAIKQMAKKSTVGNDSKKADLYYGQLLFKEGGDPREEFVKYPGISNIACFIDYKSTKFDDWHISELCGKTLSSLLFDMKGEFCKGERVYAVKHLELHKQFKHDGHTFKAFIRAMAEAMDLFSNYYIVHCDIKPENILVTANTKDQDKPFQLKIIDFGSAYNWGDTGKVRMATPEYMPPEFLNALIPQNGTESTIEQLAEISKPWSVDIWSLGAVLLEVITGIPLWIPLKCKLDAKGGLKFGLFAVKARSYDKIYLKQKELVMNLGQTLSEYLHSWPDADNLFDLLQNMLKWDPKKRISPADILNHPYLKSA